MSWQVIKATTKELQKKAFQIREEVFVVEQKVSAEDEFDQYEPMAHHFVALDETNEPIGSARWRETEKGIKLERFTVKKSHRSKGLGSLIVKAVLDDISHEKPKGTYLYLHAQLDAVPLYAKFEFKKEGDRFDECGIMHYKMWKEI